MFLDFFKKILLRFVLFMFLSIEKKIGFCFVQFSRIPSFNPLLCLELFKKFSGGGGGRTDWGFKWKDSHPCLHLLAKVLVSRGKCVDCLYLPKGYQRRRRIQHANIL